MNSPDKFEDYLERRIVKKQQADKSRAEFLTKTSELSKLDLDNRIRNEGPTDINSNALIKETYDLIMGLVRAKMLLEGYSTSGEGAHEAEVSFTRKIGFSEAEVQFLNYLRFIRNGISYYGKIFTKEDAHEVINFLNKVYSKLRKSLR